MWKPLRAKVGIPLARCWRCDSVPRAVRRASQPGFPSPPGCFLERASLAAAATNERVLLAIARPLDAEGRAGIFDWVIMVLLVISSVEALAKFRW
jgi:hypothetical protein